MDRFSKLHPIMQLLHLLFTFIFVLSVNNPFFSAVSLLFAFLYGAKTQGKEILKAVKFIAVILAFVSVFNMLFVHYGQSVLFTIKSIDYTVECLFYGFNQGMILSSVIIWFSAYSRIIDSEKIIYLFRFSPKCALIFSMVFGFIPRFTKKLADIRDAQKALNGGKSAKNLKDKFTQTLSNFSALISYSLESSIITADSMTARAYNPKAVAAGRYKFTLTDIILILLILLFSAFIIAEKVMGNIEFEFNPKIYCKSFSVIAIISFAAFEFIPTAVDLLEDLLWKLSNVKN